MEQKKWENVFHYLDNCIWIGSTKFSQFQRGYLPFGVNVLTDTPKISHITKGNIFQIRFPQRDGKDDKIALMQILQVFGTI